MLRFFRQYYPVRNLVFVIGEGLLIYSAVLAASMMLLEEATILSGNWIALKCFLITFVFQTCIYYNDLYDMQVTDSYTELSIRLMQALGFSSIFLALIYLVFPITIVGRGVFVVSTGLVILLVSFWRFCYTTVLNRGWFNEGVVILGSGQLANDIISEINDKKDCGYTVAMIVPDAELKINPCVINGKNPVKESISYDDLCGLSKALKIKKIVVAIQQRRGTFPADALLKCRVEGFHIMEGYSFYEMLTGKLIVEQINPAWLIFSRGFRKSVSSRLFKRTLDVVLSGILFIGLLPLMVIIGILIKIDSRGPVLFSQDRVGSKRRQYTMHKFRSMICDAEKQSGPVWAGNNDPRVTRVGRILRKTRLDETPQLWNVLKGDMSFVGPRPERLFFVKKLEESIPYYGERFTVKPGITGWAQVSYGYGATVKDAIEKLNYDLFYTKNYSIFMDLVIIMKTVKIVLFGKGAR